MIITIIGAGMMGSAMCRPACDNGHQVRLVGTPLDTDIIKSIQDNRQHPTLQRQISDQVTTYYADQLDSALTDSDLILGGISSFGIDWFATTVLPKLKPDARVLLITKGQALSPDHKLMPFPHYLQSKRPDIHVFAVGGPCICFELMDRRHTMVCFCGDVIEEVQKICDIFTTPYYHITATTDVIGVETGAALKNAYALGVSLAVGMAEREIGITDADIGSERVAPGAPDLNPIFNPQAALFAQSCLEMQRLEEHLGGSPHWISGLPGAGDLYVTVFGGRTRRLGTLIGRGLTYIEAKSALRGVTLESVAAITIVANYLQQNAEKGLLSRDNFPLLLHMDAIINHGAALNLPWDCFGGEICLKNR